MTEKDQSFHKGYALALLYAQAHNDVEGGSQTLKTHLPTDEEVHDVGLDEEKFDIDCLADQIEYLDEDGRCVTYRITHKTKGYPQFYIEIGSSEGYFGMPEWVREGQYQRPFTS